MLTPFRHRTPQRPISPWHIGLSVLAAGLIALSAAPVAVAAPGDTTRVSVDSSGAQGNDESGAASISVDGRFVAFFSSASNLVPGDTNGTCDVFVHDRQTGTTERVSVDSAGSQANGCSGGPAISGDGRFVAFSSTASDLVPGDTNDRGDIFLHDRQTGSTERMSVDSAGNGANGETLKPAISADGRFVAFRGSASNLVPGDTNDSIDIFVHDVQAGTTERVNVDGAGNAASDFSFSDDPAVSADGRYIAFFSDASNLVPGDTNGDFDVFVHDRQAATTERVSVTSAGDQASGYRAAISADGRFVAFGSGASNLVPADGNNDEDIFVHDRQTGTTERVSVDSAGNEASTTGEFPDANSYDPAISADGRFVAFDSWASSLVPGDGPNTYDVFVHDRQTGATERVNVDSSGAAANGYSFSGSTAISGDGGLIAFTSLASNLVAADTNGGPDVFVHERAATPPVAAWQFIGFDRPVDNPTVLNMVKAGQSVSLKWRLLTAAGSPVTDLPSASLSVVGLDCGLGTTPDLLEETTAGSSGLQNLGNGYYRLIWKSPTAYAGSCKRLRLDLGEGITHDAYFQFKR